MRAFIFVDMQKDFCEGGALPVEGGKDVCHRAAWVAHLIEELYPDDLLIFTMDWHLADSDNGGHLSSDPDYVDTWPHHCVENTTGAELDDELKPYAERHMVFHKGMGKPAYSGFEGYESLNGGVGLAEWLRSKGVKVVHVAGLATDYCVRATALDAIKEGFDTSLMGWLTATIATPIEDVEKEIFELNLEARRRRLGH